LASALLDAFSGYLGPGWSIPKLSPLSRSFESK
jgi:predicted ATP-dependent Lon-type protease